MPNHGLLTSFYKLSPLQLPAPFDCALETLTCLERHHISSFQNELKMVIREAPSQLLPEGRRLKS